MQADADLQLKPGVSFEADVSVSLTYHFHLKTNSPIEGLALCPNNTSHPAGLNSCWNPNEQNE